VNEKLGSPEGFDAAKTFFGEIVPMHRLDESLDEHREILEELYYDKQIKELEKIVAARQGKHLRVVK
jgi:hypothetical protein